MKILVTGSAGYIGSKLTQRLVKNGHLVVGLIHKINPTFKHKNVKYVEGDITDIESIKDAFSGIDIVFHCAAKVKDYGSKKLFFKINYEGTKNIVRLSKNIGVKKFIFLSHINYESEKYRSNYSKTKELAEKYLIDEYKNNKFPSIIIRPGNVYGPGATIWVNRVLKSIEKNQISLIDKGTGIFHHTYIDNLLDALIAAMNNQDAIGKTIDITDGDNKTTWLEYINSLAGFIGKKPIKKNMSKKTALLISRFMILLYNIFRIEPLVTPMAVFVFSNKKKISIDNARKILSYKPKVDFKEGLERIKKSIKSNIN